METCKHLSTLLNGNSNVTADADFVMNGVPAFDAEPVLMAA